MAEFVAGHGLVVAEDGAEVVDGHVFHHGAGGFHVGDRLIHHRQHAVVGAEKITDHADARAVQTVGVEEFGVGFRYAGNLLIFLFVVDQAGVDFKADPLVAGR